MGYADVNGVCLYYEEHGSGRPLILLHGGLGSRERVSGPGRVTASRADRHGNRSIR